MNSGLVPLLEQASRVTRERVRAPTKVDVAVERILAGEAAQEVAWDLELDGEQFREVSLRVNAMKPKPKKGRQRQVIQRWL